jgi:CheY-like chemotaxis protein
MADRRCVLVVDDDDSIREIAQVALEAVSGWRVRTASSGLEGIEQALREKPDAVLLDALVPGLDARSAVTHLQAQPATRHIPVVLLAAADGEGLARIPGVAGVIAKPFDPMRLADQLARLLGWADR